MHSNLFSPPAQTFFGVPNHPLVFDAPRADRICVVYAGLLRHLVLSNHHRHQLQALGLDELAIATHGYRSAPSPLYGSFVARALSRDHDLRNVPGFYRAGGGVAHD